MSRSSRTMYRLGAAIALTLALPVLGGCAEKSNDAAAPAAESSSAPANSPTATTGSGGGAAKTIKNGCDALTAEQVKSVLGVTMTATVDANGFKGNTCDYKGPGNVALKLSYTEVALVGGPKEVLDVLSAGDGTKEPVSGLGDGATFVRNVGLSDKLTIVKKSGGKVRAVQLWFLGDGDKKPDAKDKLIKLGKLSLENI